MTRSLAIIATSGLLWCAVGCADPGTPVTPTPGPVAMPESPMPAPMPAPPVAASATYEVTFESIWSAGTHPTDFPDDAHYSGLIGGTHNAEVEFWREGGTASEGIRRMAERGSKAPLDDEVNQAIGRGTAEFLLSGGALARSPGTITMEFAISRTHALVTLVTMVAPSPDWFVGVAGLPLFANDDWRSTTSIDLYGFDAGTDSGRTYRAPDEETRPRQPIARIGGYPFTGPSSDVPLGRMTFRRKS
jgi:hypothetical protein